MHTGPPVEKSDRRQSTRSIFGSMRGHALGCRAAHSAVMSSAPPVLQDAKSFVPATTLQELRKQAFSKSAAASHS